MSTSKLFHRVTIDNPMVLISVEDYHSLLVEAGYVPTPNLNRQRAAARAVSKRAGHPVGAAQT